MNNTEKKKLGTVFQKQYTCELPEINTVLRVLKNNLVRF